MRRASVKDKKQLVLVGAGHSNLHLVKNSLLLRKNGYNMTLVSPTDLYYNGVAPGVISNYYPDGFGKISSNCHLNKAKGTFVKQEVEGIDIRKRCIQLKENESIPFDYLSINIGGRVPMSHIPGSSTYSFPIRPIERLWDFTMNLHQSIRDSPEAISVAIIGGGAAGVEIAGNVHQLIKSRDIKPDTSIITQGDSILPQFSSSASTKVSKEFINKGINIKFNSKVIRIQADYLEVENRKKHPYDFCVLATGIIPNKINSSGLLPTTKSGELIVNPFLQCKNNPHVFATGDCSFFETQPLWKSGYHAINQGPVLLKNLISISKGSQLHKYKPSKRVITALNLGSGMGLLIYGKYTFLNKISLKVKDFIEKRYINSFRC
ncbi:MAG: NAD(P)/FAD-dependent oxidoreductase [Candidatus Hodarchaeales archaeon]|jgi:NADH dehydrogenase FAD-containing subunit